MNDIDKFFSQFIGQSQGQGRFLRLSVEDNLAGGSFIGRKDNQDYLKVSIDGLDLTSSSGVQSVTAGTGITIGGTATNPIITNSAPDQTVVLTAGSGISITGTYPNFTISATSGGGTVTSVSASISGALSVSGSPITGSGTLAFAWTGTTSQYVRGDGSLATFPTIPTITPSALTKVDDTNVTLTLGGTPATSLLQAVSLTLGWTGTLADSRIASATNWNTAYTNRITSLTTTGSGAATLISNVLNIPTPPSATFVSLTTTGSSGSSTLSSGVLNVPTYTLSGLGGQPLATNLTSLSGLTYVSTSFVKMTASGTFSLDTNTYLTANQTITLSGEATGSGSTSIAVTLTNSAVIGKVLTGYVSGAGTVAATDTILQAIQKLNGNIGAIVSGVSSVNSATGAVVLTHTTNQGVSGTWTGTALSLTLGALTGVTSFNGLVVTANTGVITTGTWNGTLISTQYGGTGANNATNTSGSFLRSNGTNGNFVASTLILPNSATTTYVTYATATNTLGQSQRFTFTDATSGTTRAELTIGENSINNSGGLLSVAMSDTFTNATSVIRFGFSTGDTRQWIMSVFGLGYTTTGDGGAGNNFNFTAADRQGTMRWASASGAAVAQKLQIFASEFAIGGNTYTVNAPNALRFAPANGMRIDLQTNLANTATNTWSLPTALLDLGASTTTRASLRVRMGVAPTSPNIGDFYGTGTRDLNLNANLVLPTVGDGLKIKEGANATMGRAVLVAGVVIVNTNKVTATSEIFLTSNVDGGAVGFVRVSARVAGTSFTITSSNVLDTSTIAWIIIEPS